MIVIEEKAQAETGTNLHYDCSFVGKIEENERAICILHAFTKQLHIPSYLTE